MNDIDTLRKLAGISEAPVVMTAQDFEAGKRPKTAKDRDAYRKWKSGDSGKATAKDDGPISISPKDAKDAAERPAKAAAANPNNAKFGKIKPEDMISPDTGKPIASKQRKKSVANMFPADADINDPAAKKEVFLQVASKRPDLLFGEINARLANDEENYAISDRLSNIVRELEDTRNIMKLSQEDKTFALKLMQKAIDDMELVKATDIDVKLSDRPEQPAVDDDDDDDFGTDDEFDIDDDEMAPVLEPEDELEDSVNFDDIRAEYGIEEDDDQSLYGAPRVPKTEITDDLIRKVESRADELIDTGKDPLDATDDAAREFGIDPHDYEAAHDIKWIMDDKQLADMIGVSEEEVRADREGAEKTALGMPYHGEEDEVHEGNFPEGTHPCKQCDGSGCDHCDGKGYHVDEAVEEDEEYTENVEKTANNAFEAAMAELKKLAGI